jgi:hypothetical protein
MFKKALLPMMIAGAMVTAPAMANSFDYGLGNASVKLNSVSYSGLTYNLGANFNITDEMVVVLDYSSGKLKKTGQTDIDYSATYVGMRYSVIDLGDGALTANLGSANVNTKQASVAKTTNITSSGTRYGLGFTTAMSDTSTLAINVERDNDAKLTFTSLDLVFAVTNSLDMNISAVSTTDHNAYSVGLSHQF